MKIEYRFSADRIVLVDGNRRGSIVRAGKGKFKIRVDRHEELYEGTTPRDRVEQLLKVVK